MVKRNEDTARMNEENDANALIQRLKQQSEDNREKNEHQVQQRTFLNDVVSVILTKCSLNQGMQVAHPSR